MFGSTRSLKVISTALLAALAVVVAASCGVASNRPRAGAAEAVAVLPRYA